jgi:DNA-binding ferritin-like protein
MYRKPRFLEVLHAIREEMSREVDYDVDLFAEKIRAVERPANGSKATIRAHKNGQGRPDAGDPIAVKAERPGKGRRPAAK